MEIPKDQELVRRILQEEITPEGRPIIKPIKKPIQDYGNFKKVRSIKQF